MRQIWWGMGTGVLVTSAALVVLAALVLAGALVRVRRAEGPGVDSAVARPPWVWSRRSS